MKRRNFLSSLLALIPVPSMLFPKEPEESEEEKFFKAVGRGLDKQVQTPWEPGMWQTVPNEWDVVEAHKAFLEAVVREARQPERS